MALVEHMQAAGYRYREITFRDPGVDFRWVWTEGSRFVRWIPQNEGATLWLQLNAP